MQKKHLNYYILFSAFFLISAPSFADKELKKDFKEVGEGLKGAAKGAGKAAKHGWKKTKKWFKTSKEKVKKELND